MAVADWTAEELTLQANRLRRDVGASDMVLTNALALEYFTEAEELFPADTAKMIAQARVIALKGIRASAALLGKYAQNQSQEDLTKVFDNLSDMLKDALEEVSRAADPVETTVTTPHFFEVAPGRRGI